MLIPEHRVIFYVPETDGLVMQRAAMETRVACCAGRVRNPPPFALTPSIYGGTLSPGGISHTTSALSFNPPRPTHSRGASGPAFLNKGRPRTHLLRGLEVDTLSQSGGGGGHGRGENR